MNEMENEKIPKLLAKLALPAIVAMFVNAIYNVVDRMFIGKLVGEEALAGLAVASPILVVLFSFTVLIGIGATTLLANELGRKNVEKASRALCVGLSYGIITSTIFIPLAYIFRTEILLTFGASSVTLGYANDYLSIILLGCIFQMLSFILNYAVRQEGKAFFSMISMLSAAIINIILDYIFIAILGFGVKGAALATSISQLICFIILVTYYFTGKSSLNLLPSYFVPKISIINRINKIGLSNFIVQAGASISIMLMNRNLEIYGGTAAITSVAAASSLVSLVYMPIFGLRQGMQPIVGYNYGAKRSDRVFEAVTITGKISCVFSIVCFILVQLYPKIFLSIFIDTDSDTIFLASTALRLSSAMMPFLFILFIGISYFQSVDRGEISILVSTLRQLLIIPLIYILPLAFGLNGLFIAQPVCDFVAIVITGSMLSKSYTGYKNTLKTQV